MRSAVIVDTDILIDLAHENEVAIKCLKKLEKAYQLEVSAITRLEILVGCRNKSELRETNNFLEGFPTNALTPEITQKTIDLINQYFLSHNLLIADALIAATAITLQKPLIIHFLPKNA
ncbi:MAG TPA: PIN domain-containing protein [Candidatus Rifleibacterium sp.]|nr:PIN domain-containing protein [Candidatus Rifleibacterium sp.]